METEAKFIVPSRATFARLRSARRFGPYEKQQEITKSVHDRYVDTPDHRFFNNQLYVRLREGKAGDILLTIKRLGAPPEGAIHARDEYQVEVPSTERKEWPQSEVRSMIDEIAGDQPLVDLVGIDQTRVVSNLAEGERAVVELSLDRVTIQGAHKPLTAYELEAELLPDGLPADLDNLVRIFTEEYSLEPQPLTKFERALRLAGQGLLSKNGKGAPAPGVAKARRANATVASISVQPMDESVSEPLLESGLSGPGISIEGTGDAGTPITQPDGERPPAAEAPSESSGRSLPAVGGQPIKPSGDKHEIGLRKTDTIDTASRKIVRSYFEAMLDNEKGTLEGEDPEALHDMRVATRRMRAALRVLEPYLQKNDPATLRQGLRAIAQTLGSVRDMDVLINNAGKFRDSLPEEQRADMDGLISSWQRERDSSRKHLIRLLESKDYSRFKKSLKKFVEEERKAKEPDPATMTDLTPYQVRHVAPMAILTRYESVRSFEAITDAAALDSLPPTIEQLHMLRISGKYLRYTLECFRETLSKDASTLIRDVTKLQDQLGDLHDADVAAGLIKDYIRGRQKRRKKSEPEYEVTPGLAAYLEEREAAIQRIHSDFLSTWSRIQSREWRAKLAAVILA